MNSVISAVEIHLSGYIPVLNRCHTAGIIQVTYYGVHVFNIIGMYSPVHCILYSNTAHLCKAKTICYRYDNINQIILNIFIINLIYI